MLAPKETFGSFVRRKREEKGLGVREMAKLIGISQAYVSRFERFDEHPLPAEKRVRRIAEILGCDVDELLAMAGRVSSDLQDIIRRHPVQLAALLRATNGLSYGDIKQLVRHAENIPNLYSAP